MIQFIYFSESFLFLQDIWDLFNKFQNMMTTEKKSFKNEKDSCQADRKEGAEALLELLRLWYSAHN